MMKNKIIKQEQIQYENKSLLNAFAIERVKPTEEVVNDYDVFPDKSLLDKLRSKIIENIIDKEIPVGISLEDFINSQIDQSIEGYDLSNLERSHIFNMIEDEINGNGPLSELLKEEVDSTNKLIKIMEDLNYEIQL